MASDRARLSWGRYIRLGIGRRLSMLGERWGIDALTYNRIHFWHFHEQGLINAPPVVAALVSAFPTAQRWIDVGAGTGTFAAELSRRGREAVALERSGRGRRLAIQQGVDCRPFDLTHDPPTDAAGPFDVCMCFEVAEHLPPVLGKKLVEFLVGLAPVLVFSAAHPGQGGTGHINEQPKEYWLKWFTEKQFTLDEECTGRVLAGFKSEGVRAEWFIENTMVLRRNGGAA